MQPRETSGRVDLRARDDQPEDLGEPERHDREVVAAQPEARQTDEQTEERCHERRPHRRSAERETTNARTTPRPDPATTLDPA